MNDRPDALAPPKSPTETPSPRSDGSVDRAVGVLEKFLSGTALRGEKAIAAARILIATAGLVRLAIIWSVNGGPVGTAAENATMIAGLVLAVAWAAWVLRQGRRSSSINGVLSVTVDAAALLLIGLSTVVWPTPSYAGFLRVPETGLYLVATVTTGLRLSRRVALIGIAELALVQALMVALDFLVVAERRTYGWSELAFWCVNFASTGVLAWIIATRTRQLVYRGADAALRAERARQRLGVYVSEEVARAALESDVLEVGGRRQEIAVLFSDLRGFTAYSERIAPERLVSELNEYLDAMVRVIRDHGGVVDKFIGDAIMVVFGVPHGRADDARRAIMTAEAMQRALLDLNARREAQRLPPLRHGIGVHYGVAVAGNVGNSERLQYTVIGHVVNVASRLESASKELGLPVVISGEAVRAAQAAGGPLPAVERAGAIRVRGQESEIDIYALAGGQGAGAIAARS